MGPDPTPEDRDVTVYQCTVGNQDHRQLYTSYILHFTQGVGVQVASHQSTQRTRRNLSRLI